MATPESMTADELERRFQRLTNPTMRYQYLIQLGNRLPELAPEHKVDGNLVEGCTSRVWVVHHLTDDDPRTVQFDGDSDSAIVKGLFSVLRMVMSGRTPEEVLSVDVRGLFDRLDLASQLSPSRRNGFFSMIEEMRAAAARYAAEVA